MKATLKVKLGGSFLELNGEGKETDIVKNLSFWSSLPTKCGLCGKEDISLMHKNPKGNDYYGLKCKCGAEFTFHQFKTGGFYLTQDTAWKKWQGQPQPAIPSDSTEPPMPDNDDMSF